MFEQHFATNNEVSTFNYKYKCLNKSVLPSILDCKMGCLIAKQLSLSGESQY